VGKITAIKSQKKNSSRVSIFIDNHFTFGCSSELVAEISLEVGNELSDRQLKELKEQINSKQARFLAIKYLSRRNRSIKEMKDYLLKKGLEEDILSETITWLCDSNYLNNQKFAEEWVQSRLTLNPRGRQRLRAELYQKGISKDTIEQVIDKSLPAENEIKVASELLIRHQRRFLGKEKLEIKRKIYNFLRYRGFSGSTVLEACNNFLEEAFADR